MFFFVVNFLYNEFPIESFNDSFSASPRLLLIKFLPELFLIFFNIKTICKGCVIIAYLLKMFVLMFFKLIFRTVFYWVKLGILIVWVLKIKLGGGWQVDEGFVGMVHSSFVKSVMVSCWIKNCEVGAERSE